MPSKYFPFDSTYTGLDSNGIPQGDRGASSADWAAYVSRMFTDGYFRLLDGQLEPSISSTPMAVDIAAGSAMIKGRQYSQDETVTVSLGLSDSQPRIDRIVLRMSTEVEDRKIYLKVLKGTPAASPVAPELTRTASVYDICFAQIVVGVNAIQIIADNLTDTRDDDALCGYVKLLLDGRYYPEGSIPELLWVYTMFPETLTTGQKAVIESDVEMMGIYDTSKTKILFDDISQIGDIKYSQRTDLDNKWTLANGAEVDPSLYPDYASLVGINHDYAGFSFAAPPVVKTLYANGYFVSTDGQSKIIYRNSDDPTGAWVTTSYTASSVNNIRYMNGYWVIVGNGTYMYATIPSDTWTTVTLTSGYVFYDMEFYNGYYVGAGAISGSPTMLIGYATNIGGSWTWVLNSGTGSFRSVCHTGTHWVASGSSGIVYYKTGNPTSAWTASTVGSGNTYVRFLNGRLFLVKDQTSLYYKNTNPTDPTGTWNTKTLATAPSGYFEIFYLGGIYILPVGSGGYQINNTYDGTWSTMKTSGGSIILCITYSNNKYYLLTGATSYYKACRLPVIPAISTAYAYVKVKE